MFVHPTNIEVALEAAHEVGLDKNRIVTLMTPNKELNGAAYGVLNIDQLINGAWRSRFALCKRI
jgi:hypothetical protein